MKCCIYRAALHCEDCGQKIAEKLTEEGKAPDSLDECTYDSDDYPKGPYEVEESDGPENCDSCGTFLQNPLTPDGNDYLMDMIVNGISENRISDCLFEWIEFYDVSLTDVLKTIERRAKIKGN